MEGEIGTFSTEDDNKLAAEISKYDEEHGVWVPFVWAKLRMNANLLIFTSDQLCQRYQNALKKKSKFARITPAVQLMQSVAARRNAAKKKAADEKAKAELQNLNADKDPKVKIVLPETSTTSSVEANSNNNLIESENDDCLTEVGGIRAPLRMSKYHPRSQDYNSPKSYKFKKILSSQIKVRPPKIQLNEVKKKARKSKGAHTHTHL